MHIRDLKARTTIDEITVKVLKLLTDRTVTTRSNRELRLQEFRVGDDTGEISLVLWEDDCGRVEPQDIVRLVNGYAKDDVNGIKITPGKYGRLEVL